MKVESIWHWVYLEEHFLQNFHSYSTIWLNPLLPFHTPQFTADKIQQILHHFSRVCLSHLQSNHFRIQCPWNRLTMDQNQVQPKRSREIILRIKIAISSYRLTDSELVDGRYKGQTKRNQIRLGSTDTPLLCRILCFIHFFVFQESKWTQPNSEANQTNFIS